MGSSMSSTLGRGTRRVQTTRATCGGSPYLPEPVRLFAERDGVPPHAVVGLNPGFSGPGCLDAGQEGRIV
eukprot:scaffold107157_cov30-Phaeocystis_antarctica.AAC.1